MGWTGMPSKRKIAPVVSRDGLAGSRGVAGSRDQDIPLIEIDATFARTLGLSDGQKVTASLHVDPPLAHTVNIEPLTPADWEIIELHATFLELNLLSQIRALPNPLYVGPSGQPYSQPLTLHLSPTSTANVLVTSLTPPQPSSSPFAKIAPDGEVIVAPKTRSKQPRGSMRGDRSVTSTSKRSTGARSGVSTSKARREEDLPSMFLRGLDRSLCIHYFDQPEMQDPGENSFAVWVDRDVLAAKNMRGIAWVCVTVVKPAGLEAPVDPQKQQAELDAAGEAGRPASKIVASVLPWYDAPDSRHVALSAAVCASFGCTGIVGGVVKIEAAPAPAPKSAVQKLKIYPFMSTATKQAEGLKFGGESKAEKEEAAKRILSMYGKSTKGPGLLDGPLTDGMVLDPTSNALGRTSNWTGGILRFDPPASSSDGKQHWNWLVGSDRNATIDIQPPIVRPISLSGSTGTGIPLPVEAPMLVGIEKVMSQLRSHLSHMSSVLLTGALGAGKTSVAQSLAYQLKGDLFFNTNYFPCRKLVTDETRISTIKETLTRVFMEAAWCARLGGQSIVILDDLDKLCPSETELQVGNDNARSRQISEAICSIVKQYCGRDSGIVLLATAQAKESLHNVIVGGHVVREIVSLKAPDKEGRRRIMETLVGSNAIEPSSQAQITSGSQSGSRPSTADGSGREEDDGMGGWMDGSSAPSRPQSSDRNADGFVIDRDVDFLDLAGQTDGYMPGDLVLLVSRVRSESLIRSVSEKMNSTSSVVHLAKVDFASALKGFTPASLRNVTLQTSTTTFSSIGGLAETRKILLETLQYPTTYAPIFAQCPLRLRSGLLLYGYPGCGKTMLASAVAGECGLNFISVKGPEILNKYIGASEKSVRDLFDRAEAARPCVLFFDEFDSIAPKRGHDSTGVTDRVVNQLLTQMDGAEGLSGVYVLAATSRPDLIDPALLRPGRLDKSLICALPNLGDRVDILLALGRKLKLSNDVLHGPGGGLKTIASRTEGYSGADLQALIYNAHLEAIHDILGDSDPSILSKDKVGKTNGKVASAQNFVSFRYGADEAAKEAAERATGGSNRSKALAERAGIAAKLDSIKLAKKRAKLLQHGGAVEEGKDVNETKEHTEVIIEWKHIMKSLKGMRPSISEDERGRLEKIYREFVVGRNGEMPNGQGGTEVGGRTSLM